MDRGKQANVPNSSRAGRRGFWPAGIITKSNKDTPTAVTPGGLPGGYLGNYPV